ncbi:MAG: hypothetical protein HFI68_01685 [Lachnospiraceae bacterium]|nr:hypothetical protein [Lachnospiraceae bacterium]
MSDFREKDNTGEEEYIVQERKGNSYDSLSEPPNEIVSEGTVYQLVGTDYEEVYREEEHQKTIQEEIYLSSENFGQIPEVITRDGMEYALDEESVEIQVSRMEMRKDLDVMEEYVTYILEDNDIDRLQKEIVREGRPLELIEVEYSVTKATESGIPLEYAARCHYAANVDREYEVPVEWKAAAVYSGTEQESILEEVIARSTYERIPETEMIAETEEASQENTVIEDMEVPMAGTIERPAAVIEDIVTGGAGILLMGAFLTFLLIYRKRHPGFIHRVPEEEKGGKQEGYHA